MPKVSIVTGGCGFLGRPILERLIAEGRDVVVIDDYSTPGAMQPVSSAVRMVPCNLATHNGLSDLLDTIGRGYWVDEVWHLASPASPPLYKRRQTDTLRLGGDVLDRILSWSTAVGARVLFASSSEVYGDPEHEVQHEHHPSRIHPTGPRSCYDAAKVYGEALCAAWSAERGTQTRIARIFNTYGPGQSGRDGRLVPALVRAAIDGSEFVVHGDGRQTRTLGYVDDTVDGLFRIMRSSSDYNAIPINVGGVDEVSVSDLVGLVAALVGPVRSVSGPRQDDDDPRRRRPHLEMLRGLGWQPTVEIHGGLIRTAEWMRAHPDT